MPAINPHLLHARALQADLTASPEVWLPRRAVVATWLQELLTRARDPRYEFKAGEVGDLAALDRFFRTNHVPVAG